MRDPVVLSLLVLVFLLELGSWRATEGYQLADSVEFMERARSFERGQAMIDSVAIRPFGFSSVLVPFFALADWIGLPEQRAVAWSICLLQMALGLGLVAVAMRIGGRIGGRRTGLLAGVLASANPVFLQYSSQPVSGLAAGICAGLAVEAILVEKDFRSGLRGGLWMGAAFLMAFQSLLIAAALVAVLLVRDGLRRRTLLPGSVSGILCGLALAVVAQILIDWAFFGVPGASLFNYVAQNSGSVVTSFLARIGLRSLAVAFYKLNLALQGREVAVAENGVLAAKQSPWFYLVELPRMLVWPAILALGLGLARGVSRPGWRVWLPALIFFLNVVAMSHKGSKEFRLWLPLLPLIAALCAYGWTWLAPRGRTARLLLDVGFAAAVLWLGAAALVPLGSRRFAGYWRAMDWVDARAREIVRERTQAPQRHQPSQQTGAGATAAPRIHVASAYNWAVYLRDSTDVDLVKLPWQIDLWPQYEPERRAQDLAALDHLDLLIVHLPLLTENPALLDFLAPRFAVVAAVHDQTIDVQGLGPIFVLERRGGGAKENLLFENGPGVAAAPGGSPPAMHFVGSGEGGRTESLDLLDWRYSKLPPQGLGWVTYCWISQTGLSRDYTLVDRITCPDETSAWQNDHAPAWGQQPTSTWKPGQTLSEGYLVVPAQDPYRPGGPYRPLGGAFRKRDQAPAALWMAVVDFDRAALARREVVVRSRLSPARAGEDRPMTTEGGPSPLETRDGFRFSPDGFVRVGTFLLPIPDNARLPDDGRPIPD